MKNGDLNSHVVLNIYKSLISGDMVRHYGYPKEFSRDMEEISRRAEHEGFSFLTKTLPDLGSALDTALQVGRLHNQTSFKRKRGATFPAFLQVLWSRVLREDGSVKADPCISAVSDLRQILYLVKKYEGETPDDEQLYQKFRETDISLGFETPKRFRRAGSYSRVLHHARALITDLFDDCEYHSAIPGHGPGAVATGEKGWLKENFNIRYDCIEKVFPAYKIFFTNAMDLAQNVRYLKSMERIPSGIARCVTVPKDSRKNRLISMEPLIFQYVQQGLKDLLYKHIEGHRLTSGHVNFTDQEINRKLALQGSVSGECVTLDMSEASDRISLWLVKELFADTELLKYLLATRTEATEFPSGEIHLLRKFAPMGSALCFPVEAIVHWALIVGCLNVFCGLSQSKARASVYVYGDDIVVKGRYHQALLRHLPEFKLKFNSSKSCTEGFFRESCGMDAYRGHDVTPRKLRTTFPTKPYDAKSYVSYIDSSNYFWDKAYYSTSQHIDSELAKIYGPIPYICGRDSDVPGFFTNRGPARGSYNFPRAWDIEHQKFVFNVRHVSGTNITRRLDRCEYLRNRRAKAVKWEILPFTLKPTRRNNGVTAVVRSRWTDILEASESLSGIYAVPHSVKFVKGWSSDVCQDA